jgi:hypothetical protein
MFCYCSTSLGIKEMLIKTMLKFHLLPVRKTTMKSTNNHKCWGECGEKRTLCTGCGNVN